MSIKRLISIRNPIVDAMDMVGTDRSTDIPVFTTWAIQAEKEIASPAAAKRMTKVLTINGCRAELPCCVMRVDVAILGDHGCDCNDLLQKTCGHGGYFANDFGQYSGGFLIVDLGAESVSGTGATVNYEIQDNHIVFSTNRDGQNITIQYVGYKEDDDGLIMISENHTRAITEYILWKYGVRSDYSDKPLSPALTMEHKREWFRLCKHSRAMDNILTDSEREEMKQVFNNPYKGEGLWVNMHATGFNWY